MKKILSLVLILITLLMVGCNEKVDMMESDVVNEISLDAVNKWDETFDVNVTEISDKLVIQLISDEHLDTQSPTYKVEFMRGFNKNVHTTTILMKNYIKEQKEKLEQEGYNAEIVVMVIDRDDNIINSIDTEGNSLTSDGGTFVKVDKYMTNK